MSLSISHTYHDLNGRGIRAFSALVGNAISLWHVAKIILLVPVFLFLIDGFGYLIAYGILNNQLSIIQRSILIALAGFSLIASCRFYMETRAIARIILENEDYNVMKVKIIEEEDRQTETAWWPLIRYTGPCVVSAYTLVKIIMN